MNAIEPSPAPVIPLGRLPFGENQLKDTSVDIGAWQVPSYAVTRDGQRFLLSAITETDREAALSVVQNWTVEVAR